MSTMTSVRANGVELGVETFGRDDDPLVLLAGGPTMLSWPDSVCERLAAGGQRVVRYDLRDCGASTTVDPEAPGYHLRDLAADAAALVGTLGAVTAHLGGVGAWPTAEPFWAVAGRAAPHNDLRRRERGRTTSSRPRPGGAEVARTD